MEDEAGARKRDGRVKKADEGARETRSPGGEFKDMGREDRGAAFRERFKRDDYRMKMFEQRKDDV